MISESKAKNKKARNNLCRKAKLMFDKSVILKFRDFAGPNEEGKVNACHGI